MEHPLYPEGVWGGANHHLIPQHPHKVGTVCIPTLQMRPKGSAPTDADTQVHGCVIRLPREPVSPRLLDGRKKLKMHVPAHSPRDGRWWNRDLLGLLSFLIPLVLVRSGRDNRTTPHTGWLKQWKFTFFIGQMVEVQDQGVYKIGSWQKPFSWLTGGHLLAVS